MNSDPHHPPGLRPQAVSAPIGLEVRRIAVDILVRVEGERAYADVLLGNRLGEVAQPADRRLLTQLVLGTIAWQGRLDYELGPIASRPLDQLDPRIRAILRLGLYQLRRLTRVPAHAAVDTAVRLAGELRGSPRLGAFVNAVLREAIRRPLALPDRSRNEAEHLSVAYSHPRWLVEAFTRCCGAAAAEAILAANNSAAPNALRLNLARGAADELIQSLERDQMRVAARGLLPETVFLDGPLEFASASYRDGLFTPQSEASQLVARLVAPERGATVIDCAAAPGGKTTHLAELVGPQGRVIAMDRNRAGLRKLRALADRLGHRNIDLFQCDVTRAVALRIDADYVLLDAPCTGLGTLREHPEIRWRLHPDDPARMGRLQFAMLEQAAQLVRPRGALVYAVCSLADQEGSEVISRFLRKHAEFAVNPPYSPPLAALLDAQGFLRTRPDCQARDGFFAARLNRRF